MMLMARRTQGRLLLRRSGKFLSAAGASVDLEPKDAVLLAYLAIEGATPRATIASLLWPEVEGGRARGNFRQRLLRLKRATGVELVSGGTQVELGEDVAHDLGETHELLEAVEAEQAGELREWLESQRDRRRRAQAELLAARAAEAEARGDPVAGLEPALAAMQLEPVSEEAHRRVMRLHYLAGDASAALAAYDRCLHMLRAELGVAPGEETRRLRRQIESGRPQGATPGVPRAIPVTVLKPPRLIGRETQWALMLAAWRAGDPVFLLGEAGAGKTRLAGDFARVHGRVITVSARPGDERVVYAVAARLLRQFPRDARDALEPSLRRELARLLPEHGEADAIESGAGRSRFFSAIAAVLRELHEHAQGIVVDDLHFADEASVELVHHLAREPEPRWIFAARTAEIGPAARALLESVRLRAPASAIELTPLTLPQIREFVDSLDIEGLDGASHADALLRQTGGNPLFVLEVIKTWLAQGGVATGTRLPSLPAVGALIARRIGKLSPEAVRLARCAAIAGQDFSAELAAHVLGVRPLDLADAWSELEGAQIFREGAFAHDLIQEAACGSVPPPIARELHRELAAYLDARGAEPARVAEHWLAAGVWDRAGRALMAAAARSGAARRWHETAHELDQAARCFARVDDGASRFEALCARARTLVYCDLGEETLSCARAACEAASTDEQRLRAAQVLVEVLAHRGDVEELLAVARPAIDLARTLKDRESELRLIVRMASTMSYGQRASEALALLEPLRDSVDAHASPQDRSEYYQSLGFALDFLSRLVEAAGALEIACRVAREAGLDVALSESMSNLASVQAKHGRIRRAVEIGRQAVAMMRGDEGSAGGRPLQSQALLAHRLRDVGRYDEALPLLEESFAQFVASGSRAWIAAAGHRLALTWMQLGQLARAHKILSEDPGDPAPRARAMWEASRAELARLSSPPRGAEALERIRGALDLLAHWPEDGAYRMATLFATAIVMPEEGEALATDLAAWASAHERFGLALGAHVRAAACALALGAPRRAVPHVEAALRFAPEFETDSMYRGELWLVSAKVYVAAGSEGLGHRMLAEGSDWVLGIADRHVPASFRESFLSRNPVNRELLELALRLGVRTAEASPSIAPLEAAPGRP
ncbi:MAG: AAA family ATPase [Burkholderiales bacterium]